jgi:hypothetical protein
MKTELNKDIELGKKLFSFRDTINDKLYSAVVDACRKENIQITPNECKAIVAHCRAEVTKLFDGAVSVITR